MKKISKKLTLILIAVLCLTLCVVSLVACSKKPTHTVTVLMPDDSAAVGVDVTIKKGTATLGTVKTGNDGKAKFILEDDDYTVSIELPKHYELEENANLSLPADTHELTVNLVEKFLYKIFLVNEDGDPFFAEGVEVGICVKGENGEIGSCIEAEPLEPGGFARIEPADPEEKQYAVHIENLPEDYYYEADEDGYVSGMTIIEAEPTKTVTIFHVKQITNNVIEVKEQLSTFADQEGALVGVALDGTAQLVYNDTDKFYHLGAADGPVVVVNLIGENDDMRIGSVEMGLVYAELTTSLQISFTFEVTPEGEPSYVHVYDDYRIFLRGFDEYSVSETSFAVTIPVARVTENYYANFVNSDGVYPLTKELEAFLKVFCEYYTKEDHTGFLDINGPLDEVADGCLWLFPCYYYDENASVDPIVNEYQLVSVTEGEKTFAVGDEFTGENYLLVGAFQTLTPEGESLNTTLAADTILFQIESNGSFKVLLADGEMYEEGAWSNVEGEYTFNCQYGCVVTYNNGTLTLVDDMANTTLVFALGE